LSITVRTDLVVLDANGKSIPLGVPEPLVTTTTNQMTIAFTAVAAVVNAAIYSPGADFGSIASLFGTGLTNIAGVQSATTIPLPTQIAGTSMTVNGAPAPLFAVANVNGQQQINFQMPYVAPGSNTPFTFVINNNGNQTTYYSGSGGQPGIFTASGLPAILRSDGSLVSPANPAAAGETVAVYWTGVDVFDRGLLPADGVASPLSPLVQCDAAYNPVAQVGTVSAQVSFCGLAPGLVGLGQMNVVVPSSLTTGTYNFQVEFLLTRLPSNVVSLPIR